MTHIEDNVIYGGVDGTRKAIMTLRSFKHKTSSISLKWDGAPAIFAGIDPTDGQFFVAKKGIFNKNPKVYKTNEDIDADTSGDLSVKLKDALKYLPELGITGVVQGDFLYSQSDLETEVIDGQEYITFHPNTLVYAVPSDSETANKIISSKIGIVWHTSYTGDSFENMTASFNFDASVFNESTNVWSLDANVDNNVDVDISEDLSSIGRLFNQIPSSTMNELSSNVELSKFIEQYNNSLIRQGESMGDSESHIAGFMVWLSAKYQKEIDKRKTEKGKDTQREKLNSLLSFFNDDNIYNMKLIFDLQKMIVASKIKLINIFDKYNKVNTFVRTTSGIKPTGSEGYVAIDNIGGDAMKLVNRMEFSYNNFSSDVLKGWDKPNRR